MTSHMFRRALIAVLLASAMLLPMLQNAPAHVPSMRQTPPDLIDFEDLATTEIGTGGQTIVSDQYAARGVTFNNPSVIDYAGGVVGIPEFVHSGSNAIQQCYAKEFCATPLVMRFAEPQQRVKIWVGFKGRLDSESVVRLTAFDADSDGTAIASDSATLGPSRTPTIPVQTPLEVTTDGNAIRRVEVGFTPSSGLPSSLVFDDVEFESAPPSSRDDVGIDPDTGRPACPTGITAPTVMLLQPDPHNVVHSPSFKLLGVVETSAELTEATLTVENSGSVKPKDLPTNLITSGGGSFGPILIEDALVPGDNVITLTVKNCAGTGEASERFTYAQIPDGTRYELLGMEVTQTIQDMNNSTSLIAGKSTYVRVYLRTSAGARNIYSVSGKLQGCHVPVGVDPDCFSDGSAFPPIAPLNTITVNESPSLDEKRRKMSESLVFELPPEWTRAGVLRLRFDEASLLPSLPCDGCKTATGPDHPSVFEFVQAPPVVVDLVDITYSVAGTPVVPTETDHTLLKSWLERTYPSADVIVSSPSVLPIVDPQPILDNVQGACNMINTKMFEGQAAGTISSPSIVPSAQARYYGVVRTAPLHGPMTGCASIDKETHAYINQYASGSAGSGDPYAWDPDDSYADFQAGHELAHTYLRDHPGACGESHSDTEYPFLPGGYISKRDLSFGFDVDGHVKDESNNEPIDDSNNNLFDDSENPRFEEINNAFHMVIYAWDEWHEIMTYCDKRWISSYTYEGILSRLRWEQIAPPAFVKSPMPPPPPTTPPGVSRPSAPSPGLIGVSAAPPWSASPSAAQTAQEVLIVSGTIDLNNNTADLGPFSRLPGDLISRPPTNSEYRIVLRDSAGNPLVTQLFVPREFTDQPAGVRTAQLAEVVPWDSRTTSITIERVIQQAGAPQEGTPTAPGGPQVLTLAARPVSPSSPQVRLISPNGGERLQSSHLVTWTATDNDHDPLTFTLLYSTDAGTTWLTAVSGITDQQYTVDLSRLPGSDRARFRVIATDGVNTGQDESDVVFSVARKNPGVRIISPQDGASFGTSNAIVLTGEATDLEQGELDGSSLQWSSDVQGLLGEGRSISVRDLAPGRHVISLTAKDNDGQTATSTVVIEVAPEEDDLPKFSFGTPAASVRHGEFLYNSYGSDDGIGTIYASDGEGGIQRLRSFDVFLHGWTAAVPGNFGGDGYTDLLLYATQPGLGEFYASDGKGGLQLLSGSEGFTKGWDIIVSGDFGGDDDWTDLFFYDRDEPVGKFYTTNGDGRIQLLGTPERYLPGWTSIVAGDFGGDDHTDLLFYDKSNGLARFYTTDGQGNVSPLGEGQYWPAGWSQIVPGNFANGDERTDLFLYNADEGHGEFFTSDGQGGVVPLGHVESYPPNLTINGGDFGGDDTLTDLFFYHGTAGQGTFYTTDGSGGLEWLSSVDGFADGWDLIVPGYFGGP